MRKLSTVLAEQARAELDDRDLRSRSDARKEQKTEAERILALATRLSELKEHHLLALALSDELTDAVHSARLITSARARTRQVKRIRKLLRSENWLDLEARIDALVAPSRFDGSLLEAQVRKWAERIDAEQDTALSELLHAHPGGDRAHLRRLMRTVQSDDAAQRDRAYRKLLAELRQLLRHSES